MTKRFSAVLCGAAVFTLLLASCGGGSDETAAGPTTQTGSGEDESSQPPLVGYVTNGPASFWDIASVGAKKAGDDLNAIVLVRIPAGATIEEQNRMMEELIAAGANGIAISPINPENQLDMLNEAAEMTTLITHDSDAPTSDRLCYVGMDNYAAGRMCGELVKEAMPDGGDVMIFVGRLDQDNSRLRRQGVIDELLDRDWDASRYDTPGETLSGGRFTILDTRTDEFTHESAKRRVEDTIARYPDIDGMIGLFAYNPPAILQTLEEAGKLGEVTVIGFDEADETLQAIIDGHCYGTVVQNPYMYGYESVRILTALANGDDSVLPEGGFLNIEGRQIKRHNVEEFWADLKEKMGDE